LNQNKIFYLRSQMMGIQNHPLDRETNQVMKGKLKKRPVKDRKKRFGSCSGEWKKTGPFTSS